MERDFKNATIEELKAALGIGDPGPKAAPRSTSKRGGSRPAGVGKKAYLTEGSVVVVPHSWRVALKGHKHVNTWNVAHHLLDLDYWARKAGLRSFKVTTRGVRGVGR